MADVRVAVEAAAEGAFGVVDVEGGEADAAVRETETGRAFELAPAAGAYSFRVTTRSERETAMA